jgi:hypothetical protein
MEAHARAASRLGVAQSARLMRAGLRARVWATALGCLVAVVAVARVEGSTVRVRVWSASQPPFLRQRLYSTETIRVEYAGEAAPTAPAATAANFSLDASAMCSLAQHSATSINLTCAKAEMVRLRVQRTPPASALLESTLTLRVEARLECFDWFVSAAPTFDAPGAANTLTLPAGLAEARVRVWVVDFDRASPEEWARAAVVPSQRSRELSAQFLALGEVPVLHFFAPSPVQWRTPLAFNRSVMAWEGTIATGASGGVAALRVRGKGVTVWDCSVAEKRAALTVTKFANRTWSALQSVPSDVALSSWPTPHIFVARDACSPETVAAPLVGSPLIVLSSNGFADSELVRLVEASGAGRSLAVAELAWTRSALVVAANDSVWFSTGGPATQAAGVSSPVDRVQAPSACNPVLRHDFSGASDAELVAAWREDSPAVIFLSDDGGRSFVNVSVPSALFAAQRLHSVEWVFATQSWLVLAEGPTQDAVLLYRPALRVWTLGAVFAGAARVRRGNGNGTSNPRLVASRSGSGDVFVFGDAVHFSPNGGLTALPLAWDTGAELESGEFVVALETSAASAFALLTSRRRLLFGAVGVALAREVDAGVTPAAVAGVMFRLLGAAGDMEQALLRTRVQVLTPVQPLAAPWLAARTLPLEGLLGSSVAVCPYSLKDTSLERTAYLDLGERLSASLVLTVPRTSANRLSMAVSDASLLAFTPGAESALELDDGSGRVKRRRDFEVGIAPLSYNNRSDLLLRATGDAAVRVLPALADLGCASTQTVTAVHVGCPPGRHLRVRGAWGCAPQLPNKTALWARYDDISTAAASEGAYSRELYGCPFRVFHSVAGYRPVLDLYDGDRLVREVRGDFVMREVRGRGGFHYERSASDAGCVAAPQTWGEMLRAGSNALLAWSAENYVDCHSTDAALARPLGRRGREDYQVLNASWGNRIVFDSDGDDGEYLFAITVLDPSESFCPLYAHLALDVYGAPMKVSEQLEVVGYALLALGSLLAASYFHYRRQLQLKKAQ